MSESQRVGRRRTQTQGKQAVRKTKKLGHAAQVAIAHNDRLAEDFIETLEAGVRPAGVDLGRVVRPLGGGRFEVKIGSHIVKAMLRHLLQGPGRFHHNPEVLTAVRTGGYVVVEDTGLGNMGGGVTHRITAVLSTGQASRAKRALGRASSGRSSSSLFRRSSEEGRNAKMRANALEALNLRKPNVKPPSNGSAWF
jgi:hypothetical protein